MTKQSKSDTAGETGRRLEIEITPEMIEAGEDLIYQHEIIEGGLSRSEVQECAKAVFLAMTALSPSKCQTPTD